MKLRIRHIIAGAAFLMSSCMQHADEPYLKGADFQPDRRILTVDYMQKPDTTLHQVIALSGIRSSGYGVLINVDGAASERYLDEIRERFKKLDINAVHIFSSAAGGGIDKKTRAAVEGARFTWVFCHDREWFKHLQGSELLEAISQSAQAGGIHVKGP